MGLKSLTKLFNFVVCNPCQSSPSLKYTYMTDFFLFARLKLPNVLICIAKKISIAISFPACFDVPKASNFTSGGVQNRETTNRRLETIEMSFQDSKPREKQISQSFSYCELINLLRNGTIVCCLKENNKMSEESVFCEAWSPEVTSQSFPVSCFWSCRFVPHRN